MELERHTEIKFEVFSGYQVIFVISADIKKSAENWLGRAPDDFKHHCLGFTAHNAAAKKSIIFVGPNAPVGTVVHECWHAVHGMFKHFGVEFGKSNAFWHR